jgi:hypothetical protein
MACPLGDPAHDSARGCPSCDDLPPLECWRCGEPDDRCACPPAPVVRLVISPAGIQPRLGRHAAVRTEAAGEAERQ